MITLAAGAERRYLRHEQQQQQQQQQEQQQQQPVEKVLLVKDKDKDDWPYRNKISRSRSAALEIRV